jgi:hypothetical protein
MTLQMKRAMAQKTKAKDSRKATTTRASQKSQIFASVTRVNTIAATAQTMSTQGSSRGTMIAVRIYDLAT